MAGVRRGVARGYVSLEAATSRPPPCATTNSATCLDGSFHVLGFAEKDEPATAWSHFLPMGLEAGRTQTAKSRAPTAPTCAQLAHRCAGKANTPDLALG
ncbi:hypothetical protein SAMN05216266_101562 [Amycolatopsis marina]|uniref:Uncharacterized protein n=1 Tax=Amycolatopsis marina TaxID=490629 RepID=A0A1I0VWQ2_9PSEU|nr:hypothetical protein SAMN05216266_101562 [Amycolatopsis marina]